MKLINLLTVVCFQLTVSATLSAQGGGELPSGGGGGPTSPPPPPPPPIIEDPNKLKAKSQELIKVLPSTNLRQQPLNKQKNLPVVKQPAQKGG